MYASEQEPRFLSGNQIPTLHDRTNIGPHSEHVLASPGRWAAAFAGLPPPSLLAHDGAHETMTMTAYVPPFTSRVSLHGTSQSYKFLSTH